MPLPSPQLNSAAQPPLQSVNGTVCTGSSPGVPLDHLTHGHEVPSRACLPQHSAPNALPTKIPGGFCHTGMKARTSRSYWPQLSRLPPRAQCPGEEKQVLAAGWCLEPHVSGATRPLHEAYVLGLLPPALPHTPQLIPRQGSGSQGAQGSRPQPQQGGPRLSSPDTACDSKPKAALHTKAFFS